jgi:hypothetical protein
MLIPSLGDSRCLIGSPLTLKFEIVMTHVESPRREQFVIHEPLCAPLYLAKEVCAFVSERYCNRSFQAFGRSCSSSNTSTPELNFPLVLARRMSSDSKCSVDSLDRDSLANIFKFVEPKDR